MPKTAAKEPSAGQGAAHPQWQSPDGASLLSCNRPSADANGISIGSAVFAPFSAESRCTSKSYSPDLMRPLEPYRYLCNANAKFKGASNL